ncbi:MAG: aminotransferase class I/II-fold pyridoxal phosphate-dependent enzyme [Synergistaceae bacterium]|jgi:methionine-gamma-lyase|nr:aminotransferase class I/II-fold pyridoxal phosphate-dependent enzyme [Synergistaceae bacterium]
MSEKHLSTELIHTGDGRICRELGASLSAPETLPIYLTSVFAFDDVESADAVYEHESDGYIYSRMANPNADAVSKIIASADGTETALVFSSGMAAITTAILSFVKTGDHIVASNVLYGGVHDYLSNEVKRFGIETTFANFAKEDISKLIRPNTKIVYVETISNPLMDVPDIAELAEAAHANGALLFVDNTFATPVVARPHSLGADVVLYSATKYLGGHSDIVGGAASAKSSLIDEIKRYQVLYGSIMSPSDCWLLARSLRTLELRMKRHSSNAVAVADFLSAHPGVEKVFYPGLPDSPSHEAAKRQFLGGNFGGMLSVNLKGGARAASSLIKELDMIQFVPSLAGTATTVSYAIKTSHRHYHPEELDAIGIIPGQVRFSIGLEDVDDIVRDISRALGKAQWI